MTSVAIGLTVSTTDPRMVCETPLVISSIAESEATGGRLRGMVAADKAERSVEPEG